MAIRQMPLDLTAGYQWTAFCDYPEEVLPTPLEQYSSFNLALRGPATVNLTGTTNYNGILRAAVNASQLVFTATLDTPGAYQYVISATVASTGGKLLLESGVLNVDPDPANIQDGADLRTHAQKVLDFIEQVIEGRASKDVLSYQINGRSLQRTPIKDLIELRDRYRDEVRSHEKHLPRHVIHQFGTR